MPTKPIFTKLTKKALMAFPERAYLASNCMQTNWVSIYEETILPMLIRHVQWRHIVFSGADSRMCRVFGSKLEYQQWLKYMSDATGHPLLATSQIHVSSNPETSGSSVHQDPQNNRRHHPQTSESTPARPCLASGRWAHDAGERQGCERLHPSTCPPVEM